MNLSFSSGKISRCEGDGPEPAGAFPRRWHFVIAAIFFSVIAVYGSWVPLNYQPLDFGTAVDQFLDTPYLYLRIESRADFVANILLFVPITFCWLAALTIDQTSRLRRLPIAAAIVLGAAGFSIALEFSQLWFPGRTVSQNDIIAESLGGMIGAAFWLVAGNSISRWIRSAFSGRGSRGRLDPLLMLYVVGLLIYMVLPLDLTIRPAEIWRKLSEGKIFVLPELPSRLDFDTMFELLRDVGIWIPVGMWTVVWMIPRERTRRSVLGSMLLSGLIIVGTEVAQVFVYSRYSSSSDVLLGLIGAAIGVALMHRWRSGVEAADARRRERRAWRALGWCALALLVALGIGLYSCHPFEPLLTDRQQIEERLYGILRVPFAAMYRGTEFNAVGQVLWKGGLFAMVGAFLAGAIHELRLSGGRRWAAITSALMFAATVALGIELCQVLFPPHVPDITDVMISCSGTALGMFAALKVTSAAKQSSRDSH